MNYSYWELDTIYKSPEILIIGAGFTGLWTAISLKEKNPKYQITIADAGNYPLGASTRNAGFACFGSITEILSDAEKMGWSKTLQMIQNRWNGLQRIQKEIPKNAIDFENCGGYELLNQPISIDQLQEVNQKIKSITGTNQTFEFLQSEQNIFNFGKSYSKQENVIFNALEGSLHPGKLLYFLIHKCYDLGVQFLWNHSVQSFKDNSNFVEVNFPQISLNCQKLVVCTNAFTQKLIPELNISPARGQVLVTSEIQNLKVKGIFHSDEGYIYFRNLGNRILLGGMRNLDFGRETSFEFGENDKISQALKKYLHEIILPDEKFIIDYQWTGIMGMGQEKSILIGQTSENVHYAVRLSGMGVALAPTLGEKLSENIIK